MDTPSEVEYKVVLVFPGFGDERGNAEEIIEAALAHLNTEKSEPGFRFAYNVSARLEIVADLEQAHVLLETDDDVAMFIIHDLPDEERNPFTFECMSQNVPVCYTIPTADQPRKPRTDREKPREWKFVFKARADDDDEPRAHKIAEATLTAPLEEEEDLWVERVQQLIAVMALGVMEHHWARKPPRRPWVE